MDQLKLLPGALTGLLKHPHTSLSPILSGEKYTSLPLRSLISLFFRIRQQRAVMEASGGYLGLFVTSQQLIMHLLTQFLWEITPHSPADPVPVPTETASNWKEGIPLPPESIWLGLSSASATLCWNPDGWLCCRQFSDYDKGCAGKGCLQVFPWCRMVIMCSVMRACLARAEAD